jgi:hypothetical protein
VTFRDKDIRVLNFFVTKIFNHVAEHLFYFAKNLAKKRVLVLEEQKIVKIGQRASNTTSKNFITLPLLLRKQLNYSRVSIYLANTVA